MKYGILITDLTADQARTLLNDLGGTPAPAQTFVQPSAPMAPQTSQQDDDDNGAPDANAPSVDATGLPWDERIHAKSKAINKDGTWKSRRGVQPVEVSRVEAELRAAVQHQAPAAPPAPQAPMAPAVPAWAGQAPVAPQAPMAPTAPSAPVAPPAPQAAPIPAAPSAPVAPVRDFQGLTNQITNLIKAQAIAHNYPQTIVDRINTGFNITTVTTLSDIVNEPAMIDYAWQCLDVDGKSGPV